MSKDETPTSPARKRGAQPGNTNALQHGFYSRSFRPAEVHDLASMPLTGLEDELFMLRVVARRTFALAATVEDLDQAFRLLGALGLASVRLATLLRTQKLLAGSQKSGVQASISQALVEVMAEMKLKPPPSG